MAGWRVVLFALGIALLLLAFASPVAAIGEEELFSFHMLQHVLIGDLAPLCLLAGLSGPMLRPLLAFRPVERLRVLANPALRCRSGRSTSTSGTCRSSTRRPSATRPSTRSSTSASSRPA